MKTTLFTIFVLSTLYIVWKTLVPRFGRTRKGELLIWYYWKGDRKYKKLNNL